MKHSSHDKKQALQFGQQRQTLLRNLAETKRELDLAYAGFNQSSDPDLIDFYLFEIDALRARHTYLLRQIKQMEEPMTPLLPADQTASAFQQNPNE
jgi:hypothetical protein